MAVILDDDITDANSINEVITSTDFDEIDEEIVVEDITIIDQNTDFIELTSSDGGSKCFVIIIFIFIYFILCFCIFFYKFFHINFLSTILHTNIELVCICLL